MSRYLVVASALLFAACADQTDLSPPAQDAAAPADTASELELALDSRATLSAHTALSGGATTVFDATAAAFSHAAPNLSGLSLARHEAGDAQFEVEFIPAAPGAVNGGLGPAFDNVSCEDCHVGDGRGRPPLPGDEGTSLLYRASVPGKDANGGPKPAGVFGGQLELHAVPNFDPEITAVIDYVERQGSFSDGSKFSLRVPHYTLTGVYTSLPGDLLFSPRVAPMNFGLGLLEAIPEADIVSRADPRDRNRDGISGRANSVWDAVQQRTVLGRFGWKAGAPSLFQQTAGAYNGDMGITSPLFPSESCEGRPGCEAHAPEVSAQIVGDVAFYTQTLGVPARRSLSDPTASKGERLFYAAGCTGCHTPTQRTGFLRGVPEVSGQIIHPYTDLLLHDMGDGLADNRPDFLASGNEWRTPPLWGIGLVQTVNGHTNFLHDGRARSLLEAVLWHGGEAANARDRVRRFSAAERAALLAFLQSL